MIFLCSYFVICCYFGEMVLLIYSAFCYANLVNPIKIIV